MKILAVLMVLAALLVSGCSFETVPPAHKGKILTTAGYSPDILEPGKYTLWGRDRLIMLETNTNTYKEAITVILADKLTLTADVRFRGRIDGSQQTLNAMFNDVLPGDDDSIQFGEIYRVYGQMLVRNKAREVLSLYTVEDVHKNYARLSKEIGVALVEAFKFTPLAISDVSLGDIQYPTVVTEAINTAKERQLAIEKEKAQAEIEMTKKDNERRLAEADYQIQITKAKAIRDQNRIIAEGITDQLLEFRRLEVLEGLGKNNNAMFIPVEGLTSPGAQMRMYGVK